MVLGPISEEDYELGQREKKRDSAARGTARHTQSQLSIVAQPHLSVASLNRLNSRGEYELSDKKLEQALTSWRKELEHKYVDDDLGALSRRKINGTISEIERAQRIRTDNDSGTPKDHKYASLTSKLTGSFQTQALGWRGQAALRRRDEGARRANSQR